MTPEQIADEICTKHISADGTASGEIDAAIVSALRQARADALEEAKTCALLERGEGDAYPPFWNVCCSKIADHIEALKHKDQK